MVNPQKAKGTRWESAIVTYLRDLGFTTVRREVQHGRLDVGDISGLALWAIEAKNYSEIKWSLLSRFVAQANREAVHAGKPYAIVVLKKPRAGTGEAYVIMDLNTWAKVISEFDKHDRLDKT
jgi:Holliday junction resolvase